MANDLPFVSIITPVYNDTARLKVLLENLEKQTYPSDRYEVIVVDNASKEPVAPALENAPHARIVFEAQGGPDLARNAGIRNTTSEYLAFIDSDCIPYPDWLESGIRALLREPDSGLVGGRVDVFPKDPNNRTWVELMESVYAFPTKANIQKHHFMPTCNMFTTKKVFDAVGLFNGELKSSGDEEWGQRVYAHGYKLVYDHNVAIRHPARRTLKEINKKTSRVSYSYTDLLRRRSKSKLPVFLQPKFLKRMFILPVPSELDSLFKSKLNLLDKGKVLLLVVWSRTYRAYSMIRALSTKSGKLW
jgi:glycosyltransferase involved in cell wall biosynthesis